MRRGTGRSERWRSRPCGAGQSEAGGSVANGVMGTPVGDTLSVVGPLVVSACFFGRRMRNDFSTGKDFLRDLGGRGATARPRYNEGHLPVNIPQPSGFIDRTLLILPHIHPRLRPRGREMSTPHEQQKFILSAVETIFRRTTNCSRATIFECRQTTHSQQRWCTPKPQGSLAKNQQGRPAGDALDTVHTYNGQNQ